MQLYNSIDETYWEHPFLTRANISAYRAYSESLWLAAERYWTQRTRPLKLAFCVNMAQNMHNWARLAKRFGIDADLFLDPLDRTALSRPEWEDFDGEWEDIFDGPGFAQAHSNIRTEVRWIEAPTTSSELLRAWAAFQRGDRRAVLSFINEHRHMRPEVFFAYPMARWHWELAKLLTNFDAAFIGYHPMPAYFSGIPYSANAFGGDLIYSCGRFDDYGNVMSLSFAAARFLLLSNVPLGHCRRLGFSNALFVPYVVDTDRYAPGDGHARADWEMRYGKGFYVLVSARLDASVKGFNNSLTMSLISLVRKYPNIRFIFLTWGNDRNMVKQDLSIPGLERNFIFLKPVGKKRLIDYYRSCDCVVDQLAYGYYACTALEAMAVGKPVIMKIRTEHYDPLLNGDIPPMLNVTAAEEVVNRLEGLYSNRDLVRQCALQTRRWLVRNHGHERWGPILFGLLALTADRVPVSSSEPNPLRLPLSDEESAYHRSRIVATGNIRRQVIGSLARRYVRGVYFWMRDLMQGRIGLR
jgi:glycosyltransferase involved in cell wall biosynthesis